MTYAAAIDQLNAMAPELYDAPGRPRRKFSLAEFAVLLKALGVPQERFRSVLIAGTNGKGSTASTLASILMASGLRVGLYTSPHLERPNERIRVHGADIADEDFARHFFAVRAAADHLVSEGTLAQSPSFFETLTAMSFLHFAEQGVDLAVLEVGMGGRLDATNVVQPLVSVITDISLDHTEWLGPTIDAIAREKAGILRPSGILVTLPQHPDANQAIGEIAVQLNTRGVSAAPYMPAIGSPADRPYTVDVLGTEVDIASPLRGAHQQRNVALAIATAVELATTYRLPITAASIGAGIRNTRWPGRLERIDARGIRWILDVAHNPAGAWALRAGLRDLLCADNTRQNVLVFSCLRDKPIGEMAQILFPLFDRVIFAPILSPRATPIVDMLDAARSTGTQAQAADTVEEALQWALEAAQRTGNALASHPLVIVSGSVYLVGDVRTRLMGHTQ